MKNLKRVMAFLLLAGVTLSTTGCSISLFSSEHKHYHHDKCEDDNDKKCKTKCSDKN